MVKATTIMQHSTYHMNCKQYIVLILWITGIAIASCQREKKESEALAKKYCGSCHLFPEPHLLDKITWKDSVLPAMGRLLNVPQLQQNPFEESDMILSNKKAQVSKEDWQKIVEYYFVEAPSTLPVQPRPPISGLNTHFDEEPKILTGVPGNTFLRIDAGNKRIYASGMDSLLRVFDHQLNLISEINVEDIVVDMQFDDSLGTIGSRKGVLTRIGIMNPNDLKTGSASIFTMDISTKFVQHKIFDTIQRPVQISGADLDMDGKKDYLVCGFGNHEGAFFWMKNTSDGKFEQKMILQQPGAIKSYVEDFNGDQLPDIITLFAQGQEGIYFFENRGNGVFDTKELLSFPPVFGSTYFEMRDFNHDGLQDIVYTCGDNADYSNVLKNYHGVYIFLNQGNFVFKKHYFFPLHGAFKAIPRDFDLDGDLDIAAISFFPDRERQPSEGFVFLEQVATLEFEASSIKNVNDGHWITLDAGDLDGDGDEDIVIGSLFLPIELNKMSKEFKSKPTFLVLRNRKNCFKF